MKAQELIKFIKKAHTTYQATTEAQNILNENGFIELNFQDSWQLLSNQGYYITKNDSSIIAFKIGNNLENLNLQLVASHNDSPTFKIKPNSVIVNNDYTRLNTEPYGGVIFSSWLDKPLGLAGKVMIKEGNVIQPKIVELSPTVVIPNVAIHLNRGINENNALNANVDMPVLLGLKNIDFNKVIKDTVGEVDILDYDLFLYNKEEGCLAGANQELICAPRLDNLECYYTSLQSFLNAHNDDNINMWAGFNNEEVGASNNSADSTFLMDVIDGILDSLQMINKKRAILARSMMVSADNAHAIHPNHPEKSDGTNNVKMNEGIVIKYNAGLNYTTDSVSGSIFKALCEEAKVPYQSYTNRSDLRGGGTLGRVLLKQFSVVSVDIGLAQLAMHSSYETAGVADLESMYNALCKYYNTHVRIDKNGNISL